MEDYWLKIDGIIEPGHQVASGRSNESPYPAGTIELQKPFFKERGLDLTAFFDGTLNISIRPYTFTLTHPQYTFRGVGWTSHHPPEDFSFSPCVLLFNGAGYNCWIYYPHLETKTVHFQDPSIIEVLAPFIPDLNYGDRTVMMINAQEVTLSLR
jgi:hypothetical protein